MSELLSSIFGSELEKKQDEITANQIVEQVSEMLSRNDAKEEIVVKAVNNVLCKWAKDKDSRRLVEYVFDKLIETYPQLHKKYHFQKPSKIE